MEAGAEGLPFVRFGIVDAVKFGTDFGIDGTQHGFEQAGLVGEMVVQGATGHARLGRERVERDLRETLSRKGGAGGRHKAGGGAFGGFGAGRAS